MNIFVLDSNPEIAASYHCDQHLHKMILESAQMLSSWAWTAFPKVRPYIYKPTHANHPCTLWLGKETDNRIWLILLARELNKLHENTSDTHASIPIIEAVQDCIGHDDFPELYNTPNEFIFTGSSSINLLPISPIEKYQRYYRYKHRLWLDTKRPMTYKNRPIPPFMQDLF